LQTTEVTSWSEKRGRVEKGESLRGEKDLRSASEGARGKREGWALVMFTRLRKDAEKRREMELVGTVLGEGGGTGALTSVTGKKR